jgi:hypothetical protein
MSSVRSRFEGPAVPLFGALLGAPLVALLAASCLCPSAARALDYVPPPDVGYVNVKVDCGANGDGVSDDTGALKSVLEAGKNRKHPRFGAGRLVYIPDGVYIVSDQITWGDKKKTVFGQSRERTIIRLRDSCPGFQDPKKPRCVFEVRGRQHFAQNFYQRIRNLTVDVGRGNAGAVGIEFHTNNGGGVYDVTIRSSDPGKLGAAGLSQTKGSGPGLIWNVLVDGFDVGSLITGGLHSMAFYDVTLENQRVCGFENRGNTASVGKLVSRNRVPAVRNRGGYMCVIGGDLTGGVAGGVAVENEGHMLLRHVRTSGYRVAVRSKGREDVPGGEVEQFTSREVQGLFGGSRLALGLPVEEPPVPPYGDPVSWTVVRAKEGESLDVAIQRAIDGGAETVFISGKEFGSIRDTIHVRGRVRRIMGAVSYFRTSGFKDGPGFDSKSTPARVIPNARKPKPVWRIEDGEPDVVMLEFLADSYGDASWTIEHASKRTLVCFASGGSYRNTVAGGRAFFIDCGPYPGTVITGPQKVWAWHANTESYVHNPHIVNRGGTLWVLGVKTEKDRTIIGTYDGGRTELCGGLLFKNRQRIGQAPAFVSVDSDVSLSYRAIRVPYSVHVKEAREGVTKELPLSEVPEWTMPLYVGRGRPRPRP